MKYEIPKDPKMIPMDPVVARAPIAPHGFLLGAFAVEDGTRLLRVRGSADLWLEGECRTVIVMVDEDGRIGWLEATTDEVANIEFFETRTQAEAFMARVDKEISHLEKRQGLEVVEGEKHV